MADLNMRNQKIIDALLQKAQRVCPGSLALVGIYGSFSTGDIHEKSDLDLLILINDDAGWQLATLFLQEDLQVGHDLYCTSWESLRQDACYTHPHIAKLLDSKIVYCAESKYLAELEALRKKARDILAAPVSREDYRKAQQYLHQAQLCYARAMIAEDLTFLRTQAAELLMNVEDGLAMLNKRYFRYGVRRTLDALEAMPSKPDKLSELVDALVCANSMEEIRQAATMLMKETTVTFESVQEKLSAVRKPVRSENIQGTYEEMFSNWRNKLHLAAERNDRHLSFMSLMGIQGMLADIAKETDIGQYDALSCYNPDDLAKTARSCDALLEAYLAEYRKAGISVKRYPDIDAFVMDYLK